MHTKLSHRIVWCYFWLNFNLPILSPQQSNCYAGTMPQSQECEVSVPSFAENNDIRILNFINCAQAPLFRDTFQNLHHLQALSISCQFHNDSHLEIEEGIFSLMKDSLNQLNLNFNNMDTIPNGTFCELTKLTNLDLSYNSLNSIKYVGFGIGCEEQLSKMNLTHLDIKHNSVRVLHNATFYRLSDLFYLDVSNNGIDKIEINAFEGLVALQILNLDNNELVSMPENVFENLSALHNLSLANNRLMSSSLPTMKYPSSLRILDLRSNHLSSIEELSFGNLSYLTQLDLSDNQFEILQSRFSSLNSLSLLSINSAGIKQVKQEAFQGLISLTTLELSGNQLSAIEPGTLDHCPKLQILDISDNVLHTIPDTSHLKTLHTINLSNNNISKIGEMAKWNLNALYNIDLSENAIETIDRGTFRNLTGPTVFNLSHNAIKRIEPGAFEWIPGQNSPSSIYLDYNQLTTIEDAFYFTNVTFLSVSHNALQNFSYSSVPLRLQTLDLSHNKINKLSNEVAPNVFEQFKVKTIDLSHNELQNISNYNFPHRIQELYLHNNSIMQIDELFLKPLYRLRNLTLHNNKLKMLCPQVLIRNSESLLLATTLSGNPFICSCELSWIQNASMDMTTYFVYIKDLSKITCKNVFPKYGSYESFIVRRQSVKLLCHSTFENPNSCKCTPTKVLPCTFHCPKHCICYRDKDFQFAIVDCSSANLTSLPVINFRGVAQVLFYLDGNMLNDITATALERYSNVTKLFLNSSNLHSVRDDAFQYLKSLTVLHLDNNFLRTLPSTIFYQLSVLEELYLDHNEITYLSSSLFFPLISLQVVDISNNLLNNFTVWHLSKQPKVRNISLQNNPWSCECRFVERFRHWLQNFVKIVNDAEQLVCIADRTGEATPLISSSFSNCNTDNLQQIASTTEIWGSILGIVILLIIVCIMIFIYRQEMQVLIYSRYGVRVFSDDFQENERGKLYDAFISYSCLDEEFLIYDFLPGLEHIENPYKLCLHHRDFTVGAFITENIMDAVEKSRRTILLLSENFIQSEWCRFEFKAAHVQMLKDRCNRVIIVVLDKIPKNLDPEMKLYLTTNTYLTWGDKLFWKKLYFAMPDLKQSENL